MQLVLLAALVISPNLIYTKMALQGFEPQAIVLLRLLLSTITLFGLTTFFKNNQDNKIAINFNNFKQLFICGFFGAAFPYFLQAKALESTSTIFIAILMAAGPLITWMLNLLINKSMFSMRSFIGIILGFVGIMILISKNYQSTQVNTLAIDKAIVYVFLSTLSHSISWVLGQKFKLYSYNSLQVTLWQHGLMSLLLSSLCFLGKIKINFAASNNAILGVALSGMLVTGLGQSLYWKIMRSYDAVMVSLVGYCRSIIAALMGYLFLQEAFYPGYLISGVLIYLSLFLCKQTSNKTKAA